MTNRIKIKTSISADFKRGNYYVAFTNLLSLPHYEVASLLSKKLWLEEKGISQYFWESFCIECHERLFNEDSSETILNWYLKDPSSTSEKLNELLVKNYPNKFIKSIKRNRSFLNESFLERICDFEWSEEYSITLMAFDKLRKDHLVKQEAIESHWNNIHETNLPEILSQIIHWVDEQFYLVYSDGKHEKLRQIFSYALAFILTKKKMDKVPSEAEFTETFLEIIRSSQANQLDSFLRSTLDWLDFETAILSSFCFDDNFVPVMLDNTVTFKYKSKKKHDAWIEDGERYAVNASRYYVQALHIYNYQDEEGFLDIPSGKSEQDEDINHKLYIQDWLSRLFLQDLHIRNLFLGDKPVHASKVLIGLNGYSTNRRARCVEPMKSASQSGQSWYDSFLSTIKLFGINEARNLPLPFMFISSEDLTNIYKYAIPEFSEEDIHHLIEHFSFEMSDNWKFDPFNICLSIIETPFIRFGEFVFTSTSFFATNEWFYSIAQRVLNLYSKGDNATERNETATEMEVALGKEFESKGWNVRILSASETNKIDGDIDIFIDDTVTQVLIQLKRTKLKLDLASNYKDMLENDLKAAGQLNEAVISIRSGVISSVKIMSNHEKWIVTTSFEGVLKQIDGCTKVNYFDLLWALRHQKFASLNELKEFIEADTPFVEGKKMMDKLNALSTDNSA